MTVTITNAAAAFSTTKVPDITATNANRNTVKLAASFTRLSPSSIVFTFFGILKYFNTELAATASGGEMIPPSNNPMDKVNRGTSFSER